MRSQDIELLVWCAAEVGIFLLCGLVTIRLMRRATTPIQRLRRLYGVAALYALIITLLWVAGFSSTGYTVAGSLFYGCIISAFHVFLVSPLFFVALRITR